LLRQYTTDPSNEANKSIEWLYSYDPQGNILTEYRDGGLKKLGLDSSMHGMERYSLKHSYDKLNNLVSTTGDFGYKAHTYTYDSLGNMIREQIQNKGTDYQYNKLNQQVQKIADGKDTYGNTFDKRGNLVQTVYYKNKNSSDVTASYVFDATNRMVKGANESGKISFYIYNGLGIWLPTNG
jgi:YD repeat-containing protein